MSEHINKSINTLSNTKSSHAKGGQRNNGLKVALFPTADKSPDGTDDGQEVEEELEHDVDAEEGKVFVVRCSNLLIYELNIIV